MIVGNYKSTKPSRGLLPLGMLKGCRLNAYSALELLLEVAYSCSRKFCYLTVLRIKHTHLRFPLLSASIILVHSTHSEKSPHLLLTQPLLSPSLLNPLNVWYCVSLCFPFQEPLHLAFSSELTNPIMHSTLPKTGTYRIQLIDSRDPGFSSGLWCSYIAVISLSHSYIK